MLEEPVDTRLYLSAPPLNGFDAGALADLLAAGVACLTVDVSGFVEAEAEALERMIALADAAECPLLAGGDDSLALELARRFALDGVHLSGGPKQIGWARKQIGESAIVGYGAGLSREDALVAAEGGADYVMFSPVADVDVDLLRWWQAVIETPVVAGEVTALDQIDALRGIVDFIGIVPDYTGDASTLVRAAASGLSS